MTSGCRLLILLSVITINLPDISAQESMPDNVCVGETKFYRVDPNPGSTYIWWLDGKIQSKFNGNEFYNTWAVANTFFLEVQEYSSEGCPGPVRSCSIFVTPCLVIPEAFSPNGDLINDVWNILNIERYPAVEITVFNRWGQPVWKSEAGYPFPWDGKSNGKPLPVDSYFYLIDLHNGSKPIPGNVTIVR
jgi:gliding motility-associated-like protein